MHLDWWTLGLQTINFAVLVFLLQRFLYKPVLRMIDARKAEVQRQYDDAKAIEDKAKAHLAAIEAERAGIAAEREQSLKIAAAEAQQVAEARRAQAEHEAEALLGAARKTLTAERERAREEVRRAALDLGAEFARRLLAEVPIEFSAQAWVERIEQYLNALPKPERDALTGQIANGDSVTVVTASPLSPAMRENWRDRLRASLGHGTAIAFNVNLDLIAGAELHFPATVLRFTWQSALADLRSEVGGHADAH